MGLHPINPTFHSLQQQGGKSSRIVNCILAVKSYGEWKQIGGNGTRKFGGTLKPATPSNNKHIVRKNSDPFTNSLSRILLDEVPILLESLLSKVMEEFENHIANQVELAEEQKEESARIFPPRHHCQVKTVPFATIYMLYLLINFSHN
ncbi:hypothetical protein L6452_03303 [Arctium lappa]|uniref:Uncharacterized protein n=1 Tax=Arctium lappa TaxID=4217 RepID=A0ACB9FMV2_ARCLA|nr:hypothetical protein L6452_03303 [Arctium lappa]